MRKQIAVLPGDGIGPEVMEACLPILQTGLLRGGHTALVKWGLVGWRAFDVCQDTMPVETWDLCRNSDCILFGAVGLPGRDSEVAPMMRPERRALLPLRRDFGLGCNIRPVTVYDQLQHLSPLRDERLGKGVKITFFRELLGGEYFGVPTIDPNGKWAEDTCRYTREQIESIARAAFQYARGGHQSVTSVDKANVLCAVGTFWREVVQQMHDREFSDVPLQHVYVDAFNLGLFTRPSEFQVVLTSNTYGDILSDGVAGLAGSMGLLPSASLNPKTGYALYEPGGGSAPDIAGQGIANPIAMILSIAMMFRFTFGDPEVADDIERAVKTALEKGCRTKDLVVGSRWACLGTQAMAQAVLEEFVRD